MFVGDEGTIAVKEDCLLQRPGKLFTANQELLVSEIGVLNGKAFDRVLGAVVSVLRPTAK